MIINRVLYILLFLPLISMGQFHIGDSTKLHLGLNTLLFAGGNTTFNGPLTNNGKIVSYRDLDFVDNSEAGNLKFTGDIDQNLRGDTINVGSFEMDKTGNLVLLTGQVRAIGSMTVTRGVVKSDDELDLIQAGNVDENGTGFVEGKMIGRLGNSPTFTFPMGITDGSGNGFKNYLTLTANKSGTFIRVECRPANPNLLFPDSLINGIADEVEWWVSVVGADSVEATVKIDYEGVDLAGLPELINADIYQPTIAMFFREDTLHHALNTVTNFSGDVRDADGLIESNQRVWISSRPRRFSIALMPFADGDVFYIPNVFAPGASFQENRIFRPFYAGSNLTGVSIVIRDSFSQIVYEVNDSGPALDITEYGWDGILPSGLDAPGGVYYYEITMVSNGTPEPFQQAKSLLLIR